MDSPHLAQLDEIPGDINRKSTVKVRLTLCKNYAHYVTKGLQNNNLGKQRRLSMFECDASGSRQGVYFERKT